MRGFLFHAGFSLIEIIVVIALLGSIASMGALMSMQGFFRNSLNDTYETLYTALLEARAASMTEICTDKDCTHSASHGVHSTSKTITLFEGSEFADRSTPADTVWKTSNVTVEGATDIVFTAGSGVVEEPGTITLSGTDGATRTITVTGEGAVY